MRGFLLKAGSILFLGLLFLSCGNKNPVNSTPVYGDSPVYPPADEFPAWSPDGRKIIYTHHGITKVNKDGFYSINENLSGLWLINPDGSDAHLILKGPYNMYADWSPDGRWIVFGQNHQIFKVPFTGNGVNTSQIQQLTFTGRNFFPSWSSNGRLIAYSNSIGDTVGTWIISIDSSEIRKYFAFGFMPDWKPGNNTILYAGTGLWVEALDHSFKLNIFSNNQYIIKFAKYSFRGSKIAFESSVKGQSKSSIFLINSDGSHLRRLHSGGQPYWSPDGRWIVYDRYLPSLYDPKNNGSLWIIDTSMGLIKRQLTYGPNPD